MQIVTIGGGFAGSAYGGGGTSDSDVAWVREQTGIYADDKLYIRVENHTQVDGAVINSGSGDLTLNTGTLGFSDILDHDTASSTQVNVGISNDPKTGKPGGATLSGSVSDRDKEQITRATVGEGEITIRDPDAQQQDVAALNRDLDKAQEITKDESSGVDFYVSTSAIQEIASKFETTQKNLENLSNADKTIPANMKKAYDEARAAGQAVLDALVASGKISQSSADKINMLADKVKEMAPDSLCSSSQSGFNFFDLFVTTAHAAPADACTVRFKGGEAVSLTAEEVAALKQLVLARAQYAIEQLLPAYNALVAKQENRTLTPDEQRELRQIELGLQNQFQNFELCSDSAGGLKASGLVPSGNAKLDMLINVAEAYRLGGETAVARAFGGMQIENPEQLAAYLNQLRSNNPVQYGATMVLLYGADVTAKDAVYSLSALSQANLSAGERATLVNFATEAYKQAVLNVIDPTSTSSSSNKITDLLFAINLAGQSLTIQEKVNFVVTIQQSINSETQSQAKGVAVMVALYVGPQVAEAIASGAVKLSQTAMACFQTPACLSEAGIALGEMSAGDALAGSSLIAGGYGAAERVAVKIDALLTERAIQRGLVEVGSASRTGGLGPWAADATNIKYGVGFEQCLGGSCVSATGQILTEGARTESQLLSKLGEWSNPEQLAIALNEGGGNVRWIGAYFNSGEDALRIAQQGTFGAILQAPLTKAHMVTISPTTQTGVFLVQDTAGKGGATYEVTAEWIKQYVAGGTWRLN